MHLLLIWWKSSSSSFPNHFPSYLFDLWCGKRSLSPVRVCSWVDQCIFLSGTFSTQENEMLSSPSGYLLAQWWIKLLELCRRVVQVCWSEWESGQFLGATVQLMQATPTHFPLDHRVKYCFPIKEKTPEQLFPKLSLRERATNKNRQQFPSDFVRQIFLLRVPLQPA